MARKSGFVVKSQFTSCTNYLKLSYAQMLEVNTTRLPNQPTRQQCMQTYATYQKKSSGYFS